MLVLPPVVFLLTPPPHVQHAANTQAITPQNFYGLAPFELNCYYYFSVKHFFPCFFKLLYSFSPFLSSSLHASSLPAWCVIFRPLPWIGFHLPWFSCIEMHDFPHQRFVHFVWLVAVCFIFLQDSFCFLPVLLSLGRRRYHNFFRFFFHLTLLPLYMARLISIYYSSLLCSNYFVPKKYSQKYQRHNNHSL